MPITERKPRKPVTAKMTSEWFDKLSPDDQHEYLENHPHSKYWNRVKQQHLDDQKKKRAEREADEQRKKQAPDNDADAEDKKADKPAERHRHEVRHDDPHDHLHVQKPEVVQRGLTKLNDSEQMKPHSDYRKQIGNRLMQHSDKVASHVTKKMGDDHPHAETAMSDWIAGKPVTGRNKSAMRKATRFAFNAALVVMPGGLFALAAIHFGPRIIRGALNRLKDPRNAARVAKDGNPYKSLVNAMGVEMQSSPMHLSAEEIEQLSKGKQGNASKSGKQATQ